MKAAIAEGKGRERHEESLNVGESCLFFNPSFNLAIPTLLSTSSMPGIGQFSIEHRK